MRTTTGRPVPDYLLVDTHCHLDFDSFEKDIEAVMGRAAEAGVTRVVVPAVDLGNVRAVLTLADRFEGVFAAVGVHPNSAAEWRDEWPATLRRLAGHPKVVAIGEIGLDYYWHKTPKDIQHRALTLQLDLAAELELPVILHNREAGDDLVSLLKQSSLAYSPRPGVLHSFSAGWEIAEAALTMGFYIGFTGPITYKKAGELRDIAGRVPLNRILIETDAPFLAPHPHRGRRNEPAYVRYIAERLAEIRDISPEEVAQATTANAAALFRFAAVRPIGSASKIPDESE